jgi:hypothetical protein
MTRRPSPTSVTKTISTESSIPVKSLTMCGVAAGHRLSRRHLIDGPVGKKAGEGGKGSQAHDSTLIRGSVGCHSYYVGQIAMTLND